MTVITQVVLIYALFDLSGLTTALDNFQAVLLISSTALLTAGGNVINDVYDVAIDQINKPSKVIVGTKITEKTAMNLYFVLTILGVGLGFVLANMLDKILFSSIFIILAFLLYLYASQLKSMLLVGNIVISLLVSMVLIVTVIFDLLPAVDQTMIGFYQDLFLETLLYAGFAFVLNLGREWIKDCQDMNGDRAGGRSTLPLVIGKARTQKLTAVLLLVAAIGVGFIVTVYFYQYSWIVYPLVYGIIAPLMYISLRLWQIKTNKELTLLSLILKVTMLLGILSMILVAKIPINA